MIILHAGQYDGNLTLWGEVSWEGHVNSVSQPPRKKTSHADLHPFAAGIDDLLGALEEAVPGFKHGAKWICSMAAWLPTKKTSPVPSNDIIYDLPKSRTKAKIVPWAVAGYRLSTEDAVNLLCVLMGKHIVAPGVLVGADLAYWADALRLAGSMVTRQQFLPSMTADSNSYRGAWIPIFVGKDAELFDKLARRMPAVGRALSEPDTIVPPKKSPIAVLGQILATLTDHLVRTAVYKASHSSIRRRRIFDSMHDLWLHSLISPDGLLETKQFNLPQLAANIHEWQLPVAALAGSPFRLCFRLEAPDDSKGDSGKSGCTWHISYLLQPHDDPSLLVPADEVWMNKAGRTSVLERKGPNAKEFLLLSLGQASGICPGIAASMDGANLTGHAVDTAGAYEFLTREATALEQAGYGVMLPSWWTGKGTKTRLAAKAIAKSPKMRGGGGNKLSLDTIVEFDWEVAIGDQKITLEELEELARIKSPLVRARGQWMEVNAAEINQAIRFLKKRGGKKAAFRDILMMKLGAEGTTPSELNFDGISATGWIADVLDRLDAKSGFKDLKPPKGFSGTLRPYQLRGYSWLSFLQQWGLGGCLADDMGLGKTIQILALIQNYWQSGGRGTTLLVCPTSVMSNWQKEAARFTPGLPVILHHGAARSKGASFKKAAAKHALVVSSYGLVQRDAKLFGQVQWSGVVLDEAQNIKNPNTKQAASARSLKADYRFALTGTPVENNVGDLWSIMEFLNPSFLGTQGQFKRNFFVPIQAEHDPDATDRLRHATGPFILRRLKTDKSVISDLPEKMEMKVFCHLTEEQASMYTSVLKDVEDTMFEAEGIQRKGMILATLSKLKQVCNHPAQFLGDNSGTANRSGKLARLTEMLEEVLEVGEKALVFTQFVGMGNILKRHLQETFGREVLFLHGGVPKGKRDLMVERFQDGGRDGPQIFILSIKAGGTGLNLTAANHVFHFDRWWNPAVESQATDRAFRIGQKRNVQVRKLVCVGTLEEKIDEMIEHKRYVAENVIGTGESWLTKISNEDLRDVLSLSRKEAVRE